MNKALLVSVLLFAGVFSVRVGAADFTYTDASGTRISLGKAATRIVSLSPAITEILYASGAGGAVVGVTSYCNFPVDASAKQKIAGFGPKSVNMEAIIALSPDIVIGELGTHVSLSGHFANSGIRLALIKLADFGDIANAIELMGSIAGTRSVADSAVASFKGRIAKVEERVRNAGVGCPVVYWEVWDEPLMSAGAGTFIDMLITKAGGRNCFYDVREIYPMVSFEQVVTRNPDVIITPVMVQGYESSVEKILRRPGWKGLKAVRERRVYVLDNEIVSRPGPRLADALELIAERIHPALFPVR